MSGLKASSKLPRRERMAIDVLKGEVTKELRLAFARGWAAGREQTRTQSQFKTPCHIYLGGKHDKLTCSSNSFVFLQKTPTLGYGSFLSIMPAATPNSGTFVCKIQLVFNVTRVQWACDTERVTSFTARSGPWRSWGFHDLSQVLRHE